MCPHFLVDARLQHHRKHLLLHVFPIGCWNGILGYFRYNSGRAIWNKHPINRSEYHTESCEGIRQHCRAFLRDISQHRNQRWMVRADSRSPVYFACIFQHFAINGNLWERLELLRRNLVDFLRVIFEVFGHILVHLFRDRNRNEVHVNICFIQTKVLRRF